MLISRNIPESLKDIAIKWVSQAPFFFEFVARTTFIIKNDMPTIGIRPRRNKLEIAYNEDFLNKCTDIEREAILIHEYMHIITLTHDRMNGKNSETFNIASDICINDEIEKMNIASRKMVLPEKALRVVQITEKGYDGKIVSEPIYDFLNENDNSNGDGSGDDDLESHDDHSGLGDVSEVEREYIKEITETASVKGWGTISGNIKSYVEDLLKPEINWKKQLKNLVTTEMFGGNYVMNTWVKANRRNDYLQGTKKLSNKMVIAIDTSGSTLYYGLMKKFFTEIENALKDVSEVTLIQWDTSIKSVSKYKKGDWKKIEIKGGGGTSIKCLYDYMKDNKILKQTIFCFTDGEFDHNFDSYGVKSIFITTNVPVARHTNIFIKEN